MQDVRLIPSETPYFIGSALYAILSISKGNCFESALETAEENLYLHSGDFDSSRIWQHIEERFNTFAERNYTFDGMLELMLEVVDNPNQAINSINILLKKYTSDMIDEDFNYWNHHENPDFMADEKQIIINTLKAEIAEVGGFHEDLSRLPRTMAKIKDMVFFNFFSYDGYWCEHLSDWLIDEVLVDIQQAAC